MSRLADLGADLQHGRRSVNIVGRRRLWAILSGVVVLVSLFGVLFRGLDLGVEFSGGAVLQARNANSVSVEKVRDAVDSAAGQDAVVQAVGVDRIRVETAELTAQQARPVAAAIATAVGVPETAVTTQVVGPSWGDEITRKALLSLVVFLALLVVYLSMAFEWKMAAGAVVALLHDLAITTGLYAIVGFTVTPATVIGLLTILGYSLYDTVVVFDKVRENTADVLARSRSTYSDTANLAVNQTLARSVNTTVIALLPVAGLLFVGAGLLGAGTLKDLALVLFIGILVGAYSSICLATPFVAALKEREPEMQALARRAASRRSKQRPSASASPRRPPAAAPAAEAGESAARSENRTVVLDKPNREPDDEPDQEPDRGGPATPSPGGPRQQPKKAGSRARRGPAGKKRR